MRVEPRADPGQAAAMLARVLMDALDAYILAGGGSHAEIARRAGMKPQQLSNIQRAVRAKSGHVLSGDVLERLATAIEHEWKLEPAAPEKDPQ